MHKNLTISKFVNLWILTSVILFINIQNVICILIYVTLLFIIEANRETNDRDSSETYSESSVVSWFSSRHQQYEDKILM